MSLKLLSTKETSPSSPLNAGVVQLLAAYESGTVKLWAYDPSRNEGRSTSVEGLGWRSMWEVKVHVESGRCTRPFQV